MPDFPAEPPTETLAQPLRWALLRVVPAGGALQRRWIHLVHRVRPDPVEQFAVERNEPSLADPALLSAPRDGLRVRLPPGTCQVMSPASSSTTGAVEPPAYIST
jgi:hypothetical protein